jgi:hypothetical protein
MSASRVTFDFDLEDGLDESFDAIPPMDQNRVCLPSMAAPEGTEQPSEEILLSELVCTPRRPSHRCSPPPATAQLSAFPDALSYSPLALLASGPTLVRCDLFGVRF